MDLNAPIIPRRPLLIPYLVLAVSLIITAVVATYVSFTAQARDRALFENVIERNQLTIQRRLESYVSVLRGAAGLFTAHNNNVSQKEFRAYFERLGLAERYPGMQGIGVSGMSVGTDVSGLAEAMRKQGVTDFEIRPPGPRPQYHAIVYLEPESAHNRQAIGYDMFTEPVRRAAMEMSRDSGDASTSGKVNLTEDAITDTQTGFVIYVPIYFTNTTPATVDKRRATLGGFIFSPFRADDLLTGIFGGGQFSSGVSFSVYDAGTVGADGLLYSSDKTSAAATAPITPPRFAKTVSLDVPGRHWTVAYMSGPQFENRSSRGPVVLVVIAGAVVSVLLFALTAAQASAQRRAEQSARDLRQGERDIRAAKDAAERALAQAEQASALKDEFLATVSHELRTPLNAILGWSQLLARHRNSDPEEVRSGLATIERSAKAQARLIDDLLDVSRIVAGKLGLDARIVQLAPILEATIASVRVAADAKGVQLERAIDPDVAPVNGDPARLQQIAWNLLSNAVKFTPTGGTVTVSLRQAHASVQVVVADTGIGIAPEFLPHVFERFRQADASTTRRYGGLGLGLGIVRHLVELQGGTVEASSAGENKGSTFTIAFPAAAASADNRTQTTSEPANGPSLQGVHVLVVEDDDAARELIDRVLSDCGATVTASASAADGFASFQQSPPDVIVSDIGMPDEDGYTLMERIRALPSGTRTPAVALTALARAEDRQRALKAGFHIHIAKPFEPEELSALIARAVGKGDGTEQAVGVR